MLRIFVLITIFSFTSYAYSKGTNVFAFGIYDIKFDGSEKNQTTDFKYEFRSENSLFDIGPKEDNFFFIKPFF